MHVRMSWACFTSLTAVLHFTHSMCDYCAHPGDAAASLPRLVLAVGTSILLRLPEDRRLAGSY